MTPPPPPQKEFWKKKHSHHTCFDLNPHLCINSDLHLKSASDTNLQAIEHAKKKKTTSMADRCHRSSQKQRAAGCCRHCVVAGSTSSKCVVTGFVFASASLDNHHSVLLDKLLPAGANVRCDNVKNFRTESKQDYSVYT